MSVAFRIKQRLPPEGPRVAANGLTKMLSRPGRHSFSSHSASKSLFNWSGVSNPSTSGMDNTWDPRLWTPTTIYRGRPSYSEVSKYSRLEDGVCLLIQPASKNRPFQQTGGANHQEYETLVRILLRSRGMDGASISPQGRGLSRISSRRRI